MRNLKEDIGINAGTVKRSSLLNEDYKVKEIEAMARAYSAYSNFARDIEGLKRIYEERPIGYGPVPMLSAQRSISPEAQNALRKKLHQFCIDKLGYIKEVIDETLGEKEEKDEDDEKPEIEVTFEKEE